MRLRTLALLLVLTAADYVLWEWSIAGGHDIASLVAGLALLPLVAITIGGAILAAVRGLGPSSSYGPSAARSVATRHARSDGEIAESGRPAQTPASAGAPVTDATSGQRRRRASSGRLAA